MMQHKRRPFSHEQNTFMDLIPKRLKTDVPLSSKEKKEKVSERISALQQLVSPYGKTDTASVLLEAMEYIRFLHEQLQVLIAPYLCGKATTETQEVDPCSSLRAKGLCLVPFSFVDGVSSSNGADIWAPIKTNPSNSSRLIPDKATFITGPS